MGIVTGMIIRIGIGRLGTGQDEVPVRVDLHQTSAKQVMASFKFIPSCIIKNNGIIKTQKAYDGYRLLHNLLNLLAEITSRYLNTSLVL